MVTLDDIKRWKVPALKDYLRKRGLKTSNRKEELCALVYAAHKYFFLIIKQNLNMKLFTEGFLEILEIFFFSNFHWMYCSGRAKSAIFGQ